MSETSCSMSMSCRSVCLVLPNQQLHYCLVLSSGRAGKREKEKGGGVSTALQLSLSLAHLFKILLPRSHGTWGAPTLSSNRILPLFRENVDQKGCQHKTGCSTSSSKRPCTVSRIRPPPLKNVVPSGRGYLKEPGKEEETLE